MTLILTTDGTATASLGKIYKGVGPSDFAAVLDFEKGVYRVREGGSMTNVGLSAAASNARASAATYQNDQNEIVQSTAGSLRVGATTGNQGGVAPGVRGLLVEPTVTNVLLNSLSPSTQSVTLAAGTYTLSVYGSGSAAVTGGTVTTGAGVAAVDGSPVSIVTNGSGSVTVTVTGSLTGFQLENFACATTLIATGTSSGTRGRDYYSVSARLLDAILGNQGSVIMDFAPYAAQSGTGGFLVRYSPPVGEGTNPNIQMQYQTTGNVYAAAQDAGGGVEFAMTASVGAYLPFRAVLSAGDDDFALRTGLESKTDVAGTFPVGLERIEFGGSNVGAVTPAGILKRIVFYNRKLTPAEIAEATSI